MNHNILETEAFEKEDDDDYYARLESRGNRSSERQDEPYESPRQVRTSSEDLKDSFMAMNP